MHNGWTGGQYSILRILLGLTLLAELVTLAWSGPWTAWLWAFPLTLLLALLLAGAADGFAALIFILLQLALWRTGPAEAAWPLPLIPALLIHVFLSSGPAPYGSWAARGRTDPAGGWRYPPALFLGTWFVLAVGYLITAVTMLSSDPWRLGEALFHAQGEPAGWMPDAVARGLTWAVPGSLLAFSLLAPLRTTRPLGWCLVFVMLTVILPPAGHPLLAASLAVLHLLALDPGWLPPREVDRPEVLYFDGRCGLCQRFVRFVLAEDRRQRPTLVAPLRGPYFREHVPPTQRDRLPDSVVLQRADGTLLTRSAAVLHVLDQLGGLWRVAGGLARIIPRPLRDRIYDTMAHLRHRLLPPPDEPCPLMPSQLRDRFRA